MEREAQTEAQKEVGLEALLAKLPEEAVVGE